jgi:subtilisin family serine protease
MALLHGTGRGVRIAVLDSGVNPRFPLLQNRVGAVYNCQKEGESLRIDEMRPDENSDRTGHGSYVESCIRKVAPDARIDHFRVLDADNNTSGTLLCYVLDHVVEQGYHIVHLSLGTRTESHVPWLVGITKRAYERHTSIVAAASNVGSTVYPSKFPYCISCDATSAEHPLQVRFRPHSVIEFSGWGINVPVEGPNNVIEQLTGSSYAAAHITGLAARVVEILGGTPSPLDVKTTLRDYALELERHTRQAV